MVDLDGGTLDGLRADIGGEESLERILTMYVERLPSEVEALTAARGSGDLARVREVAHRLKSSTAMLGGVALSEQLARIEAAAERGDAVLVDREMEPLDERAQGLRRAIEARLAA